MVFGESDLSELARQLRRIEKDYLSCELTPTQKAKPGNSTLILSMAYKPGPLQFYQYNYNYYNNNATNKQKVSSQNWDLGQFSRFVFVSAAIS